MNLRFQRLFVIIILFWGIYPLNAQNNYIGEVIPSPPNAAALEKFVDFPVSYFTGVPNVSVPIHTVTEGPLSVPISLNYNASGIKVEETASWVGLGWSLSAGGAISRQVMGGPDEGRGKSGCTNTSGWYRDYGYTSTITKPYIMDQGNCWCVIDPNCSECSPNNWSCDNFDPNYEYPCTFPHSCSEFNYYNASQGCVDTEPDIFYFNFVGYSGKFYFDENREAHIVPEQDVKIEVVFDVPTGQTAYEFQEWTITTPDGIKYFFGGENATEYQEAIAQGASLSNNTSQASSWYLYKVEAPSATHTINLNYTPEYYVNITLGSHSLSVDDACIPISTGGTQINTFPQANHVYTRT